MKKTTSAVVALSLDAVGPLALLALREQWRQGGSPEMAAEFAELSLAAFWVIRATSLANQTAYFFFGNCTMNDD